MENNKIYIFSFAALMLIVTVLIASWNGSQALTNEMGWILKQLPEVKSLEYLEALRKS